LIFQFLSESVLLTVVAVILATGIVALIDEEVTEEEIEVDLDIEITEDKAIEVIIFEEPLEEELPKKYLRC